MTRFHSAVAFAVLGVVLSACVTSYTAFYDVPRPEAVSRERVDAFVAALDSALEPYGFRRSELEGRGGGVELVIFGNLDGVPAPDLAPLDGSGAFVTVAVSLRDFGITVRDRSGDRDSPYLTAVRQTVEKVLAEQGFQDVAFRRQRLF